MQTYRFCNALIFILVLASLTVCSDKKDKENDDVYSYISTEPSVILPAGYDPADLEIKISDITVPERINKHFIPVGQPFSIEINAEGSVNFSPEFAIITYSYNYSLLTQRGLIEDFTLFYYDEGSGTWKPVDHTDYDTTTHIVTAYTSHFTTFVLTALPSASGTVTDPPVCILQDFPAGIGGSCGAVFTIIDENFKYYQDRDYFILPLSTSAENTATFSALGLHNALGIATGNGNSFMGPESEHKHYTGDDYISFSAHTDIDVYVMYDTRGGVDRFDTSEDAPWLADEGFSTDIDGSRYFIETTDAVQYYSVYMRSYNTGDIVHLHGNRQGVTDLEINTSYWVIVKLRDDTTSSSASTMCIAAPDSNPPALVTNLQAFPGADQVVLTWQNPDDPDFAGVVLRRSTISPPMTIGDGNDVTGMELTPQSYRDTGLTINTTYYYTVFSVDTNNNYQIGESVTVTTSADSDGDGLSDSYEDATIYPSSGTTTSSLLGDTDSDGISDGDEAAAGTDPTNGDSTQPELSDFTLTSANPTSDPTIIFTLDGSDNVSITHWMVTITSTKPLGNNTNWQSVKPADYTIQAGSGEHTLYAWARDAAGNVSNSMNFNVTLEAALGGYVRDADGNPIAGALLRLYNETFSEYTGSELDGYYEFIFVPSGTYNLVASRDGFILFSTTVIIP